MTIKLDRFELDEALGRGGMAVVWRARHVEQDVPVAVKVMTQKLAREQRHRDAFFEEVRSVARLNHPGIVMVLDVGEVGTAAAAQLFLPPRCPYLAMELVEPGALSKARLPPDWETAYELTTQLLDALAHAHARGVIHRDIKGDNILVAGDPAGEWQAKLSDFGLARLLDEAGEGAGSSNTSGTPRYMAPEQIMGEVRRQGPWTDLYALGCVVWWFVCGTPPFIQDDPVEVMKAHLKSRLPPLEPRFDVPADLRLWLARMLAKGPGDRFRRAADAAWALHRLAGFSQGVAKGKPTELSIESADTVIDDTVPSGPPVPQTVTLGDIALLGDLQYEAKEATKISPAPPIPTTWRGGKPPPPPPRLLGAGLGLYGLRTVPMVDRFRERDALWGELRETASKGRPRLVTLRGAGGTGKSRVADSIAQRAHEVGAANVLRAVHSRQGGPLDGIGAMLARFLRCAGLDFADVLDRIVDELSAFVEDDASIHYDAMTLARHIAPDQAAESRNPAEIDTAYCNFFRAIAAERPIIFIVDDAQWAGDALRLVDALLDRGDIPVLIVLTVREEALSAGVSNRLEGWETDRAARVDVSPLASDDHHELVTQLLGLDDELARDVAQRTEGNPMFAVQLVGDWVERGVLVVGESGFELQEGADAELPENVLAVCIARVRRALGKLEADIDEALRSTQLAACLGRTVDRTEWQTALQVIGAPFRPDLESVLATAGLVRLTDDGFAFVHAFVAESLLEVARDTPAWPQLHGACARALDRMAESRWAPGLAQRRARHWEEAGELEPAEAAWMEHANDAANFGEYAEALSVLDHRDALLDELAVPADDRRRAEAAVVRAAVAGETGDPAAAERWMEQVEREARDRDWPNLLGRVLRLRSVHEIMVGRLADAERFAREAHDVLSGTGDAIGRARAAYDVGYAAKGQGKTDVAQEWYERARTGYEAAGNDNLLARALTGLGHLALRRADVEKADHYFSSAARLAESIGSRQRQAMVAMPLGDLARERGELDAAREYYRRSETLWRSAGNPNAWVAALKQVWLRFDEGDYGWRSTLERLAAALKESGRGYAVRYARLGIAAAAAAEADAEGFDDAFADALAAIEEASDVHPDLASLAEHAAQQCSEAGWEERAEAARALARVQREALTAD